MALLQTDVLRARCALRFRWCLSQGCYRKRSWNHNRGLQHSSTRRIMSNDINDRQETAELCFSNNEEAKPNAPRSLLPLGALMSCCVKGKTFHDVEQKSEIGKHLHYLLPFRGHNWHVNFYTTKISPLVVPPPRADSKGHIIFPLEKNG